MFSGVSDIFSTFRSLADGFMSSPWIYWGIGPSLAAILGFCLTSAFCEALVRIPSCRGWLLVYQDNGNRIADIAETQKKVSFWSQTKNTLWHVAGPSNLIGVALLRYLFPVVMPHSTTIPSLMSFLIQFVLLALLADLGLYWGHRIQHENEYLWSWHSFHHRLRTPTSMSTAYIDDRDAMLQSVLPLLISALVVRPHPITYSCYIFFHLSNNAWNHSGLDGTLIRLLSLKFLPLRCANTLHDAHHRFSGFKTGKNYGEMFWLWDYVFGTLTKTENLSKLQKIQ